ncbi:hypothetical protein LCGC14_1500640 [marine sediment metagenome]|uniref:Uncharacterized protein n=1 Tax=marine sediment metagenome TaxID=412755 RepID=A0A0F9LJW3_9ZZZZ
MSLDLFENKGLDIFGHLLPQEGTPEGDQRKNEFVAALLAILGDCRLLWMPKSTETTTSTDLSRHAATLTYDATFAGKYTRLGSGLYATFDGSADEADIPDSDIYSFGDGVADQAFSIIALVNPADASSSAILTKRSSSSVREYSFWLNTSDYPELLLWDESLNGTIAVADATALTQGSWAVLGATYDGSGAATGIALYKNALRVDDTDNSTGSYTAMENTNALVSLAAQDTTPVALFDGSIACVAQCAKHLSVDEMWAIKELMNGYYDLSL